jgi:hypothetical protein
LELPSDPLLLFCPPLLFCPFSLLSEPFDPVPILDPAVEERKFEAARAAPGTSRRTTTNAGKRRMPAV